MSDTLKTEAPEKKATSDELAQNNTSLKFLRPTLLLCRIVTAFIFGAWGYGTIVRPQINADQLAYLYYIKLPTSVMVCLGVLQIIIALAVLIGFQKRIARGILLALAALAAFIPKSLAGYYLATIGGEPHPVILFFTMFCLLGTSAMIYCLRDEDTLLSLGEKTETSVDVQNKLRLPLFLCRFGAFSVFFAWTWDKIFNARHGAGVFGKFYNIKITESMAIGLGLLEAVLIFVFLLGLFKRISRGLMIIFASVTTLSLGAGYIAFFDPSNFQMDRRSGFFVEFLLVPTFAMLVCAIVVYAMRDADTMFSLNKKDRK